MLGSYEPIKSRVKEMKGVTIRPTFGYDGFYVSGKFFAGFHKKNSFHVVVRLPKDQQSIAIKNRAFVPFYRARKMGWIEFDARKTTVAGAMRWISKGYEYVRDLAEPKQTVK